MDIAKYVGLYLLKNKYCCLQGLGNVEIKKTAAQHDGKELKAGTYYATLNPVGSIDDSFPNFVANNEHVSIAKASNEISEFIKESKSKMAAGGAVLIPSVGQYVMKGAQLQFELDPAFVMPTSSLSFPIAEAPKLNVESTKVKDEPSFESYNNYTKHRAVNWNIVAFWGVVIIIGGSIIGWGVRYLMNQQSASSAIVEQVEKPTLPTVAAQVADTSLNQNTDSTIATNSAATNASDTPTYKFVIKEYNNLAKAEKKQKQLFSYGYNVSVVNKDSTTFFVVSNIKVMPTDTSKIKDSLTKLLNPSGVVIMK